MQYPNHGQNYMIILHGNPSEIILSYDKDNNIYYMTTYKGSVIEIDMNSQQMSLCQSPYGSTGINPVTIFINGKLHIIGGFDNNKHFIFDTY